MRKTRVSYGRTPWSELEAGKKGIHKVNVVKDEVKSMIVWRNMGRFLNEKKLMKIDYVKQIDQRFCYVHYQARNEKTGIPVVHKRVLLSKILSDYNGRISQAF